MKRLLLAIIFLFIVQLQAHAQGPIYLPLVLKMKLPGYDVNNWRLVQPVFSQNRVLNPSAELTGNFSDVTGATTTRVTTYSHYGLYSYELVSTGAGDGTQLTTATLASTNHFVTVRVKKPYSTLQASINSNTKNLQFIEKVNENWDLLGVAFQPGEVSTATAVQILATAAETIYFDGVQVEALPYWTTYIDGTQDDCEWLASAHASPSQRGADAKVGGKLVDFYDEYRFQIRSIKGAGAAEVSIGVDSYAILPGGEINSEKIEPREFLIKGKFIVDDENDVRYYREKLREEFLSIGNQPTQINYNGSRTQREIGGFYAGGLESDSPAFYGKYSIVEDGTYQLHEKWTEEATIEIQAPNPFWYEIGEQSALLDAQDSATFRYVIARLRSTGQWDDLGPPGLATLFTRVEDIVISSQTGIVYVAGTFTNFDGNANADYIVQYDPIAGTWSALSTGANNAITALAIGPDGRLYAGGIFSSIGGVAASGVAVWDPDTSAWSALAGGLTTAGVNALIFDNTGILYAGGNFNKAGGAPSDYVSSWDGASWSDLSTGMNNGVEALAVSGSNTLYAGGLFTAPGNYIVSYDGSSWSTINVETNNVVFALAWSKTKSGLYAGGTFTADATGQTLNRVGFFNLLSWEALSSGVNNTVFDIAIAPDGDVLIVGQFTQAGSITVANRATRWNGYSFSHLDVEPDSGGAWYAVATGKRDPIVKQNYDIWVGMDSGSTGTGDYAGVATVTNNGSVPAFPKIVFDRDDPLSSFSNDATIEAVTNERTGKKLLFDYDIIGGEVLTLNLQPTNKSIISSYFGRRRDALLPNSDFGQWALIPGNNDVTCFIAGATDVTSYLLWRNPYNGY